jgi:hypothetical protein
MHDLAARPTGAVKSAVAIAIEIIILLNIDLRIAWVRARVEESVQWIPRHFQTGAVPRLFGKRASTLSKFSGKDSENEAKLLPQPLRKKS